MERIVLCDNEKAKDDKERKGDNNQSFSMIIDFFFLDKQYHLTHTYIGEGG